MSGCSHPPAYYADLYRKHDLRGGHIIKLGPGNDDAAREALDAWPGAWSLPLSAEFQGWGLCTSSSLTGMALWLGTDAFHLGGGITEANALEWLDAGAGKVCFSWGGRIRTKCC